MDAEIGGGLFTSWLYRALAMEAAALADADGYLRINKLDWHLRQQSTSYVSPTGRCAPVPALYGSTARNIVLTDRVVNSTPLLLIESQKPLAQADNFIRRFFISDGQRPEMGIHFTGHFHEDAFKSARFNFHFAMEREFPVDSAALGKWCRLTDIESVILFHIERVSNRTVRYRFRELAWWMVNHPEWVDDINRNIPIIIHLDEFTIVDDTAANFTNAVREEAKRILKNNSLLRVRRSMLVPTGFTGLFDHLGRLARLEVPEQVVQEGIENNYNDGEQIEMFLRDLALAPINQLAYVLQQPSTREWLSQLLRSCSTEDVDWERKQFGLFIRSMVNYYRGTSYAMPRFKYEDLSCWRIFAQLFPAFFPLIKTVLKNPSCWPPDQLMATFLLASTLVNSDDPIWSQRTAPNLLPILAQQLNASHVDNYDQYRVLRQYYFTCAEAGGSRAVDRCVDFMHHHPADWDLRLNQEYYNDPTNSSLEQSVRRKLQMPKPREIQTIRIFEVILDRITNRSYDR